VALAGLGLAVVNALAESSWGTFTIAMTIPVALFVGLWMYRIRPGHIAEASVIGVVGVFAAVIIGGRVPHSVLGPWFTLSRQGIIVSIAVYGFIASVLPVWMLLSPRDYLSTFLKITTILVLAVAIVLLRPALQMPSLTPFGRAGEGPVFAGKLFPFVFITIACGAISGFHALVASGTTPKMISRESQARFIGYGGMLMESMVGVMALIAACTLDPGVYFAMNTSPAAYQQALPVLQSAGFTVTPEHMEMLAREMGEKTLVARSGGAPSLAVGMAQIFARVTRVLGGDTALALWYHFAIMFEALFILTTIDAGTRVGRFMLQEVLGHVWPKFAQTSWMPSVLLSSAMIVAGWGYFLYQGVVDPLGGINSLWPLFGIANQLLAAVALSVGTTILIKMGKARQAWVTLVPLGWLVVVTMTAGLTKVFSPLPRLGFLAHARSLAGSSDPNAARIIFNDRLDAGVALLFMGVVWVLLATSVREWWLVLSRRKPAHVHEAPFVRSAHAVE
jgi:carbon starvation protein